MEHRDRAEVVARLERVVPLRAVEVGGTETVGLGVERHRVAALLGDPCDLTGHPLVAEREAAEGERDEPTGVHAAPLVDVPVVVGPDHHLDELGVLVLHEELPAQARPRREVERCKHAVDVHVADALVHVEGAGAHLVEAGGVGAPALTRPTLHRVEAEGGELLALDEPGVGAVLTADDPGHPRLELRGHVVGEVVGERRRLDDVVIDADEDEVFCAHPFPLKAMSAARRVRTTLFVPSPMPHPGAERGSHRC